MMVREGREISKWSFADGDIERAVTRVVFSVFAMVSPNDQMGWTINGTGVKAQSMFTTRYVGSLAHCKASFGL